MDNNNNDKTVMLALKREAERIEEDTTYSSKGHFNASETWDKVHLLLGVPTAIVAGVSGVSALQEHVLTAGVLAFIAAALSAVSTYLNPSDRAAKHHSAGTKIKSLNNQTRIFREVDLAVNGGVTDVLVSRLKELSAKRDVLNEESPRIPRRAFYKARKGIEEGEASYRADK